MSVSPKTRGLPANKQQDISIVLSATLEAWAHELLYAREVYPKETFGAIRYMGVKCYVNRHPGVASYIEETIRLAVPGLLQGTADQLSLLIVGNNRCKKDATADKDEDETVVEECTLEEYTLRLMNFQGDQKQSPRLFEATDPQFERSLRDLVLRVQSLYGQPSVLSNKRVEKDSISFRIELRLTETPTLCNEIKKALVEGTCFAPNSHHQGKPPAVVRPLHKADAPFGTLLFVQRRLADKYRESATTNGEDADAVI